MKRFFYVAVALSTVALSADAQSVGDRLKQKAKEKAEQRAEEKVDKAMDDALDKVDCVITDKDCIKQAKADGKKVALTDDEGNPVDAKGKPLAKKTVKEEEKAEKAEKTETVEGALEVSENFDFMPGSKILFADDFMQDRVGNFPRRLQLIEGNSQIVTGKDQRWLQTVSSPTIVAIPLPSILPEKFTVEFDLTMSENFPSVLAFQPLPDKNAEDSNAESFAFWGPFAVGLTGGGIKVESEPSVRGMTGEASTGKAFRARIQVDGEYVKVYLDNSRVANVPTAKFTRGNKLYIYTNGKRENPVMLGNIVVAAGGATFYDALLANGRVATQGIFFDTGSDRMRPESKVTLQEIADMLNEHKDLRLTIEGHTDNVGNAAANKTLSDKRAAAVKAALVSEFRVTASRLAAAGFGDTKPAAPNATSEGRQQNRRVELVKM